MNNPMQDPYMTSWEQTLYVRGWNAAIKKAARECTKRISADDSHNAPYNAEDLACAKAIRKLKKTYER